MARLTSAQLRRIALGAGQSRMYQQDKVWSRCRSDDPASTTWLYQHFAGRFFGTRNDQDLRAFAGQLRRATAYANAQVLAKSTLVDFFVDDFARFVSVVWMILLYPNAHDYTPEQRVEITEHVYRNLWSRKKPLVQVQDHVVVYRGRGARGLV